MDLYIKNMVCPRCITAVKEIMAQEHINTVHIQLGQVTTKNDLSSERIAKLSEKLREAGFELLDNSQSRLISQIKSLIIEHIYSEKQPELSLSEILTQYLFKDYSYLSKLFSSIEGITIEQYAIRQKVERIKELLSYDELTLSEIAYKLGYSSVAHISTQFKKITGMTPSQFKTDIHNSRKSIDNI